MFNVAFSQAYLNIGIQSLRSSAVVVFVSIMKTVGVLLPQFASAIALLTC